MGLSLKGILKGAGKVAGIAAPFIPGIGGIAAGVIGGMSQGGDAQKQADQYNGQVSQLGGLYAGAMNDYYRPVLDAYMQNFGYNPNTGQVDPGFNPYYGEQGSARYNEFVEAGDGAYDSAAAEINADSINRGFAPGAANSGASSAIGDMRTQQANQNAGAMRSLMVQGDDVRRQGLANMVPMMAGAGAQGVGTLQGLGAQYASKSANIGQGIGELAGAMGQTGVFDNWFKGKRKQSTSTGTSTANAAPKPGGGLQPAAAGSKGSWLDW